MPLSQSGGRDEKSKWQTLLLPRINGLSPLLVLNSGSKEFGEILSFLLYPLDHIFVLVIAGMHAKSLQLCLTLSDAMDHSLPGSSVRGILQSRILDWVAMPSSRGSSHPTFSYVSCFGW